MFDLDDICFIEVDLFQYEDKLIDVIEVVNEDRCFVKKSNVGYFEFVIKMNEKENSICIRVNDVCIIDNGELYIIDFENKFIKFDILFILGLVFILFIVSIDFFILVGICKLKEGELLVMLSDIEIEIY